ncbi:MAG TPA: glycosyltransferase [Prolixibacteraceae bacterium]|nr:glycosyltransferase [Prolixibacteraceae bacterium]
MSNAADSEYLLTIIVPLYNEEGNLPRLAKELSDYLSQTSYKAKVLFVNDGSTDKSSSLLERYCMDNNSFSFIHLKRNCGLSTAMKAGIDQVVTKYTGYIDADLQTSPYDFDLLMEFVAAYELVTGVRVGRKDGIVKRISSRMANAIRRSVTHDGVSDTGCPLKIFHTDTAITIPFFKGMHRFLPALVQLGGGKVKEVPVRHFERLAGKSNFHLWNRLLGPAADLIVFGWMRKRTIRYEITGRG